VISWEDQTIPGECAQSYTIERTWRATDACGNSSSCLQRAYVIDDIAPELTCAPDDTISCNDPVVFTEPEVSDNCDPAPRVVILSTTTSPGPGPGDLTHTRCWVAEDACGNTSEPCCQTILQADRVAPELVCADDMRLGCNEPVVFTEPMVSDNCDPEPTLEVVSTAVEPGPGACEETHTRCWIAYDVSGNVSEPCCQSIVRMVDEEPPELVAAPDDSVPCNQPVVFTEPEVSDNCDGEPALEVVSTTITPGPGLCQEIHTRCWRATDACGNQSEPVCQSILTMVDTEPPVLTCAPDKTIPYGAPVIFDEPEYSDNCEAETRLDTLSSLVNLAPDIGQEIYTRCWIASDLCGNLSNECCQTITMEAKPEPYCTFRCWDWVADCLEGDNRDISTVPACIRDDHFDDLFPEGVRVGVIGPNTHTVLWTSAQAIEDFGCGYGIPKVLTRDYVDPKRYELLGVLVGEVLALRLNREYSCAGYLEDLGYPALEGCYGNFVVPDSVPRFAGLTIDEFLAVADQAVGGNTAALQPYGANIDHLWAATAYLNWLYSGCAGQRSQPPVLISGHDEGDSSDDTSQPVLVPLPQELEVSLQPNPVHGSTTIRLALPAQGQVSIEIYDVLGRRVVTLLHGQKEAGYHDLTWQGTDSHGVPVGSGVYFCKVKVDGHGALMEKLIKL
jgi:hypothetical protein